MKLQIGTITLLAFMLGGCGGSAPSTPPADLEVDESNLDFEMPDQPLTPETPATDAPSGADESPPESGGAAPDAEKPAPDPSQDS